MINWTFLNADSRISEDFDGNHLGLNFG